MAQADLEELHPPHAARRPRRTASHCQPRPPAGPLSSEHRLGSPRPRPRPRPPTVTPPGTPLALQDRLPHQARPSTTPLPGPPQTRPRPFPTGLVPAIPPPFLPVPNPPRVGPKCGGPARLPGTQSTGVPCCPRRAAGSPVEGAGPGRRGVAGTGPSPSPARHSTGGRHEGGPTCWAPAACALGSWALGVGYREKAVSRRASPEDTGAGRWGPGRPAAAQGWYWRGSWAEATWGRDALDSGMRRDVLWFIISKLCLCAE